MQSENNKALNPEECSHERGHALWRLLKHPLVYEIFQRLVSKPDSRPFVLDALWEIEPGMTVVDIGCGPASLRSSFPADITYFGFDPSAEYIEEARRSYPSDQFHVGTMETFFQEYGVELSEKVDVIVCSGVLHHIPKEAIAETLRLGKKLLQATGRFAAIEPTFLIKQDCLSRFVLRRDRGMSILYDYEWTETFRTVFPRVRTRVMNGLLRIPYTHILIEAGVD